MQDRRLFRQFGKRDKTGTDRLLGQLEGDVMEALWSAGRSPVRRVLESVNAHRPTPVAYTTVLTVMQRLAEKQILNRERVGNTDYYVTRQSREEFFAASSGRIVQALVADFGDIAIAQFLAEIERVDPERLRRLRERAGIKEQGDAP